MEYKDNEKEKRKEKEKEKQNNLILYPAIS